MQTLICPPVVGATVTVSKVLDIVSFSIYRRTGWTIFSWTWLWGLATFNFHLLHNLSKSNMLKQNVGRLVNRLDNFENLPYHRLTGKTIGKIILPVKILVKNWGQNKSKMWGVLLKLSPCIIYKWLEVNMYCLKWLKTNK